jgi:hypothetical protein
MPRGLRTPGERRGTRGFAGALALAAAGACAAATLVAALATAEDSSPPPGRDTATFGAGLATGPGVAAGSTGVASTGAGSTGVWDPTLQRFRDPTGEELAGMPRRSVSARAGMARAERPQVEVRPDGSMVLRVAEGGFGATWGHARPEGTAEMRCAHSGSTDEAPHHHPIAFQEDE